MVMGMGFKEVVAINPAIVLSMLFLSILLVGILLERAWTFLSEAGWSDGFWNQLKNIVQSGRLHDARTMCASTSGTMNSKHSWPFFR